MVEVTLPAGAVPGNTIEFEVAIEEEESSAAPHDASDLAGVILARLKWESKPQRKQSSEKEGLSNAKLEKVYAITVPAGHKPGDDVRVRLAADGATLAVPIPTNFKPGSEVLFSCAGNRYVPGLIGILLTLLQRGGCQNFLK